MNLSYHQQIAIREEERLAVTIETIDRDVKIVPRGAYIKLPTGEIQSNPSFEGNLVN